MTTLLTALGAAMLPALLLGLACYHFCAALRRSKSHMSNVRREWMEERQEIERSIQNEERFIEGVVRVLNSNVGGISKRISESAEIAEVIRTQAPDLFKKCDGLAYWLHANDQFLVNLYIASAERIDRDHQERFFSMGADGRGEIFHQIFDSAGLRPPFAGTSMAHMPTESTRKGES